MDLETMDGFSGGSSMRQSGVVSMPSKDCLQYLEELLKAREEVLCKISDVGKKDVVEMKDSSRRQWSNDKPTLGQRSWAALALACGQPATREGVRYILDHHCFHDQKETFQDDVGASLAAELRAQLSGVTAEAVAAEKWDGSDGRFTVAILELLLVGLAIRDFRAISGSLAILQQSVETVEVACLRLSGDEALRVTVAADGKLVELRDALAKQGRVPPAWLQLVLPDGQLLQHVIQEDAEQTKTVAQALNHTQEQVEAEACAKQERSAADALACEKQEDTKANEAPAAEKADDAMEKARNRITEVFQRFDVNGDGLIAIDELVMVLKEVDPTRWDDASAKRLFYVLDVNQDWRISYEEFVNFCFGHRWRKEQKKVLDTLQLKVDGKQKLVSQ